MLDCEDDIYLDDFNRKFVDYITSDLEHFKATYDPQDKRYFPEKKTVHVGYNYVFINYVHCNIKRYGLRGSDPASINILLKFY